MKRIANIDSAYNVNMLFFLVGTIFLLSSDLKAVNIYSFAQTINSYCGLLGLNSFYGYGVLLAILICAVECLLPLLSFKQKYRDIATWCYPIILSYFTYITFVNYTDLYGGIESCGCFGELVHLSPASSFYKNIILLGLSIFLFILRLMEQQKEGKPLLPSVTVDSYIVVALLASIAPPLFSLFYVNELSHTTYLLIFITLCITSILLCIKYANRKVCTQR